MNFSHALCWIRRDLRLSDHRALYEACRAARQVMPVFVFDTTLLEKLDNPDDRRVTFIFRSLQGLDRSLRERGSALVVLHGDPRVLIPDIAKQLKADAVFTNRDYEPAAKERDETVEQTLAARGIAFHTFKDQVVFEGLDVATQSGSAFRVFTPYKNAWLKKMMSEDVREFKPNLKRLMPSGQVKGVLKPWELDTIGFRETALWLEPGEPAAGLRLKRFMKQIDRYEQDRDIPAIHGTSGLSVHLRFGTVSIRRLVREALQRKSKGAQVWLSELIWREFYQMILDRHPRVVEHAFLPQYDKIKWPGTDAQFRAWAEGRTGYPIVDAAMRHFNETGWMHNRLRMIVASFLIKDLLVDWRKGEAYFARHLLDFDLAANNGGWQWCASTGCDAQPWFRIFNPVTQSKRFDPDGGFIRSVLPELRGFSDRDIHFPVNSKPASQKQAGCLVGKDYPKPIVDHASQREKVLRLFQRGKPETKGTKPNLKTGKE